MKGKVGKSIDKSKHRMFASGAGVSDAVKYTRELGFFSEFPNVIYLIIVSIVLITLGSSEVSIIILLPLPKGDV